jgi:hypothetical protein
MRTWEAEHMHCFMAAAMFIEAARATGFSLSKTALDSEIDALNDMVAPAARLGRFKRKAVLNLVLATPPAVYLKLEQHYWAYGWERCCLSEKLLNDNCWPVQQKLLTASGWWEEVFTTSEVSMSLTVDWLVGQWTSQWPLERALRAAIRDLQCSRVAGFVSAAGDAKDSSSSTSLVTCSCFFAHWLLPKAEEIWGSQGRGVLEKHWASQDAELLDELKCAVRACADINSFSLLSLDTMRYCSALLNKAGLPASGGTAAELVAKKWGALKEAIERDQAPAA